MLNDTLCHSVQHIRTEENKVNWYVDRYMHKTMVNVVSLEKQLVIRNQEFMPSEAKLKFKKYIYII